MVVIIIVMYCLVVHWSLVILIVHESIKERLWNFDIFDMAALVRNCGFVMNWCFLNMVRLSWNFNVPNFRLLVPVVVLLRGHLDISWSRLDVVRLFDVSWLLDVVRLLDVMRSWRGVNRLLDVMRCISIHGLTVVGLVWRHIRVWHVDVAVLG